MKLKYISEINNLAACLIYLVSQIKLTSLYIGCHNDEEDSVYQDVIYGILIIQYKMPIISLRIKEHIEIHEKRLLLLSK